LKFDLKFYIEIKLASHTHPWLSCRNIEFTPTSPPSSFEYDQITPDLPSFSKIYIKKWVFSPQRISDLLRDQVSLKLLYTQVFFFFLIKKKKTIFNLIYSRLSLMSNINLFFQQVNKKQNLENLFLKEIQKM